MGNGFLNQSLHCFAISDARLDEILVEIYDTMWLGQLWLKLRRTVKYYGYLWKHALPHDFCHWFFLPPLFLTLSVSLSLSLSLSRLYTILFHEALKGGGAIRLPTIAWDRWFCRQLSTASPPSSVSRPLSSFVLTLWPHRRRSSC